MKNKQHLSQLFQSNTGKSTHTAPCLPKGSMHELAARKGYWPERMDPTQER